MNKVRLLTGVLACVGLLASCAVSEVRMARNAPLPDVDPESSMFVPRASLTLNQGAKPFVGVALSGGGSRAANFGWAVMQKLHEHGFLQHVDAVSSVSGGSLAGALYALNGDDLQVPADWDAYREKLRTDFIGAWLRQLASPATWFRLISSDYERQHAMAEVFDSALFGHATFAKLGVPAPGRPRLLLNSTRSTSAVGPESFVFSDESFNNLGSRLDSYPISHAVMASGAFPGLFGNITLNDYSNDLFDAVSKSWTPQRTYERIYDGGASDNLGLWTLVQAARNSYMSSAVAGDPMKACMFFVVDAFAPNYSGQLKALTPDTDHSLADLIVKSTAWDSIDALLASNRLRTLQAFGMTYGDRGLWDTSKTYLPTHRAAVEGPLVNGMSSWRGYDYPVFRFKLFDPILPWDESSFLWLSMQRVLDGPGGAAESSHRQRVQQTLALQEKAPECLLWHVTFQRLLSVNSYVLADGVQHIILPRTWHDTFKTKSALDGGSYSFEVGQRELPPPDPEVAERVGAIGGFRDALWGLVTNLKTHYKLTGPDNCSSKFLQDALFSAATILVDEDAHALGDVCAWFSTAGIPSRCGKPKESISELSGPAWFTAILRTRRRPTLPWTQCRTLLEVVERVNAAESSFPSEGP